MSCILCEQLSDHQSRLQEATGLQRANYQDHRQSHDPTGSYLRIPNTISQSLIFVFQDDHPGLNFMGLLIGPRGNTLKAMEKVLAAFIFDYQAGCKLKYSPNETLHTR